MRPGVDALRLGAIVLTVGLVIVAVPVTASAFVQSDTTPWWYTAAVAVGVTLVVALGTAGALGRRTTRSAARLHTAVVLVATLALPAVTDTPYAGGTPPWVLAYLPGAVAASVLVSRRWQVGLAVAGALMLAGARLRITADPVTQVVNDLMLEVTVLAVSAAVFSSIVAAQRAVEREAAATAERFLVARTTEHLGRRAAQWDAMVHDEILAALETIALAPPEVDERSLARATLDRLGEGPPTGDVDHVAFRGSLLDAVLAEFPTASSHCAAAPDARVLPPDVAEALLMAVTEALRNVAAHAFPAAAAGEVSVRLHHGAHRVAIEVSDHGCGFERSRVGPTSFGLALSIEGRVGAVGGLATVASRIGHGTTVRIQWPVDVPA